MFTRAVRRQIKDCVMEGRVKRLTREEMVALIKGRTKQDITIAYVDYLIRTIKKSAPDRLAELRESRYAFLDEVYKSKDEVERYMQELWRIFLLNEGDPYLQLNLMRELHSLTITRSNIVDVLPHYPGMTTVNEKTILPHVEQAPPTDTRRGQAIF